MKRIKILILVLTFSLSMQAIHAEGLYVGLGIGGGDVVVDAGAFPEVTLSKDTDGVLLSELILGYKFNNNLSIEVANYNRATFFGGTELDDVNLGLAYDFSSQSNTNFFVKSGVKFWSLDFTRGSGFFGSRDPRNVKRSGEDIFIQLGLDYSFSDRFKLGVAYDLSNTEFGQVRGGKLTFKWFPNN